MYMDFISPGLLILIPVLLIIGKIIKDLMGGVDNRHIPMILGVVGVGLSILWVLATSDTGTWKEVLLAIFTAFVQGVLCAGAAVYGNQLYQQQNKK